MFQYAAGRALALRRGAELRLEISGFEADNVGREFELQRVFACQTEIARSSDIDGLLGWQSPSFVRRIVGRSGFAALRCDAFVVEPHFQYWEGLNIVPQNCYLVGYWQSEKYFQDAEQIIRADFSFALAMSKQNAQIGEEMLQENSISLHVRRGDYVSNPKTNATHGICSLDYYRAAVRHMAERVENPHFFIFSDDMTWVKNELALDFPCQYIEHNKGSESYNDMRLMSLCRHHIIANSSFSWWGAWLNPRSDKIVVAPQKWFVKENITTDLYPPAWIKL